MELIGIALAWCAYFALHSLLAANMTKAWVGRHWPQWLPGYRVVFNLISVIALLPLLWLVYRNSGAWLWRWRGVPGWLADGLAIAALVAFYASTRAYDMGEFLGFRQLGKPAGADAQHFVISTFHRYVRHPWYCFGLVLIWTRDMNGPLLVTAVVLTLYLIVGSKLEERKLISQYGQQYRDYMKKVPGLVPLPWKYLTVEQAEALARTKSALAAENGIEIGPATEHDLDGILTLQDANQRVNGDGLSAAFPRARLIEMMRDMPLLVARRNRRVVGFLMSATCETYADTPIIRAMLDAYPARARDAYVYGPVCVDAEERGKGVAQALFTELKRMLPGREGVLFIRNDNAASLRSHQKMGMQAVARFTFEGAEHLVLTYVG